MPRNSIRYEMFAVEMLLSLPSQLNIDWTSAAPDQLPAVISASLDKLKLSNEAREEAERLMMSLNNFRTFFRGVAISLRDSEYGGDEPHPIEGEALAIIAKLRELDSAV